MHSRVVLYLGWEKVSFIEFRSVLIERERFHSTTSTGNRTSMIMSTVNSETSLSLYEGTPELRTPL